MGYAIYLQAPNGSPKFDFFGYQRRWGSEAAGTKNHQRARHFPFPSIKNLSPQKLSATPLLPNNLFVFYIHNTVMQQMRFTIAHSWLGISSDWCLVCQRPCSITLVAVAACLKPAHFFERCDRSDRNGTNASTNTLPLWNSREIHHILLV